MKLSKLLRSNLHVLPDFIIAGGQRCGTTSLYDYMIQHPSIAPAKKKEVHFFDLNFDKGIAWYRLHFPSYGAALKRRVNGQRVITGEATPYYLFHPHSARRISLLLPEVKILILLRNPVSRAYSHYQHQVRRGFEKLSFEEALEKEHERLQGEAQKMGLDENYYSFNHRKFSYAARGIYVDQIKRWMDLFPGRQMMIIRSEDLEADTPAMMRRVFEFLDLPNCEIKDTAKRHKAEYEGMKEATRNWLVSYYRPHNERLYEYLGVDYKWEKS